LRAGIKWHKLLTMAYDTSIKLLPVPAAQLTDMLIGIPLFQDFNEKDLAVLPRYLSLYYVPEGLTVFKEGDAGDFLGFVIDGRVEFTKSSSSGRSVTVATETTGRTFGEMAIIDGEPRSASAKFTKPGKILLLSKENFDRLLVEQPKVSAQLLLRVCRLLSQRLRRTTGLLSECMDNQIE
jgi:CRP/FNR family cyclic AMP-dependent transcriptional regulator